MKIYRKSDGKCMGSALSLDAVRHVGWNPDDFELRPGNAADSRLLIRQDLFQDQDSLTVLGRVADAAELSLHWLGKLTTVLMNVSPETRAQLGTFADLADLVESERGSKRMPYEVKGPAQDVLTELIDEGQRVSGLIEKHKVR